MRSIKRFLSAFITLSLILGPFQPAVVYAEEAEESASEKAGKQLIEKFTLLVGDLKEMSRMSDKEKIEYILTQGADRIKEQTVDTVKAGGQGEDSGIRPGSHQGAAAQALATWFAGRGISGDGSAA